MTPGELYQNLKYLSQQKIIHYIPMRSSPLVQFLTERVEPGRIRLSAVNYQDRKVNYQQRVDSVIGYALSGDVCRSRALLAYFGEQGSGSCGQCDVCQGEHLCGISNSEFERISLEVKSHLLNGACDSRTLMGQCTGNEQSILKVIRWLMDQQIISLNGSGWLELKN